MKPRLLAVLVTIPFIMAVPPLLGWFIGSWLDEKMGSRPYLMYLFLVLGLVSAFREVYRIVCRFSDNDDQ